MQKVFASVFICIMMAMLFSTASAAATRAPADTMPAILDLRERAAIEERWRAERLESFLPSLMRREKTDLWLLVAGEYNEDPVVETMLPPTWLTARRRTILMFHDRGAAGVEKMAFARYPVAGFESGWNPEEQPDQWAAVAAAISARDPRTIAVNMAEHFPLADGLSASHLAALKRALPGSLGSRIMANQNLAIGWLEHRTASEIATYPILSWITHAIIEEAFSERVITPGVTTSDDVVWWLRNRVNGLGLDTWFQPSVAIQRADGGQFSVQQMGHRGDSVIMPGDMLHTDFGISYLGLKTDVQRLAYVRQAGESGAPQGLKDGLAKMNQVKDAVLAEIRSGLSGDQILSAARKHVERAGIDGTIYTHAIGYHGHGAGTWIGAWEDQSGVPFIGEQIIQPRTAWSIELNAQHEVPEWQNQKVRFMFEENGFLDENDRFRFLDGSQNEFILIPRTGRSAGGEE